MKNIITSSERTSITDSSSSWDFVLRRYTLHPGILDTRLTENQHDLVIRMWTPGQTPFDRKAAQVQFRIRNVCTPARLVRQKTARFSGLQKVIPPLGAERRMVNNVT